MADVRSADATPTTEDFRSPDGTPIVVHTAAATARAYFLDDAETVREVGDQLTSATIGALTVTGTLTAQGLVDASGSAAGQVKFPATANDSANANTLDDYEESATTPTVTSGSGTFTTVACALKYTKIGNRVFFHATVTITTNGTAATSVIVPLPFTAAELTSLYGSSSASVSIVASVTGANATLLAQTGTYPGGDGVVLIFGGHYRV